MSKITKIVIAVALVLLVFGMVYITTNNTRAEMYPRKWITCMQSFQTDKCTSGSMTCWYQCYVRYPYVCPASMAGCIETKCECDPAPID